MQISPDLITVAAGIVWREEHFLAACRPEHKPRGGFWEFPGGKREQGETVEQALVRELHEELGIAVTKTRLWRVVRHAYPDMLVEVYFMHVLDFSGEPHAHDGQKLRWITPQEAQDLPFLPADVEIIAGLQRPAEEAL